MEIFLRFQPLKDIYFTDTNKNYLGKAQADGPLKLSKNRFKSKFWLCTWAGKITSYQKFFPIQSYITHKYK